MIETKELVVPCPFMVFKANGYHECVILREQENSKVGPLCAWFFDLFNPSWTISISRNPKTGEMASISTFDLPESEEYKDFVKRTMTEEDVPKLCPKGYTFEQIDTKIQPLMDKVDWEKVRNGEVEA